MQQTILPIAPQYFWGIVALAGIIAASLAIARILPHPRDPRETSPLQRLQDSMGLTAINGGVFFLLGLLWVIIFAMLTVGFLALLWQIIWEATPANAAATWDWRFSLAKLTALTATLAAVVAFPFTLVRLRLSQKQTDTQVESLLNDKINAAATDLAARHQVTRVVQQDGKEVVLTEWQDDLVTRAAAIDRLAQLSEEQPKEALRVANILSAYLRGNFPANNTEPTEPPFQIKLPRIDKQAAVSVLARVHDIARGFSPGKWRIDLRRCDLDGVDFSSGNFFAVDFSQSRLEAAQFRKANLTGSLMRGCLLNFADFFKAEMAGVKLDYCILNLPKPVAGGMCRSINFAEFKGMTFINADIRAINYLGERDKIAQTFGTGDTQLSSLLNSKRLERHELSIASNIFSLRDKTELNSRDKDLMEKLIETGFQYWSPYNHSDMATTSLLQNLYSDLDMLKWPFWES